MNETSHIGLLPNGLADTLNPDAAWESDSIEGLMAAFAAFGYDRIKPPLVEFEESLLDGPGQAIGSDMFRLMDPVTQRMMGVRPDITPQIARIAVTRLANAPRPLRLSYGGQVLKVRASQMRNERQFTQIGVELIGAPELAADAEVVTLAWRSLSDLGVKGISIDLNLPTLVPTVCAGLGMTEADAEQARLALDRKDAAAVAEFGAGIGEGIGDLLGQMLSAAGPADKALAKLQALDLPDQAKAEVQNLAQAVDLIQAAAPGLSLTVDATEFRGLEYQSGICFTIYSRGVRGELGRGGRYVLSSRETATGFSLFGDSLMRALPAAKKPQKVFLPYGTTVSEADAVRAQGHATLQGFVNETDANAEARRLDCSHIFINGQVRETN
ncbi:MAG: ATP phosphoribosyltransferase regulatory subunit [Alphaproteobacteria bacterium]|jgi:ATP phosphoribosyltransferase regulatory subunit|nr:ATP phosphoribosyltransferase regulatory subunit [Alphaproteobacteria bacterium]MBT4019319.1 ATP phosphoribosyltransferase regulatory subunit [Alphaproteobacteria bacterium]MBT4966714.1 ATP phosphoribosyltransferase regulatory subunit [Alphaproteobacteria bacterium]MBT5161921.1 ATP phosphoribosyltransferase regulatory subunit [Alphaproteobacteria bacterium]MBT6385577.1 ATP phosphoribosyltransferase regulatory subunit [Alphaproteobacteria bacterium]